MKLAAAAVVVLLAALVLGASLVVGGAIPGLRDPHVRAVSQVTDRFMDAAMAGDAAGAAAVADLGDGCLDANGVAAFVQALPEDTNLWEWGEVHYARRVEGDVVETNLATDAAARTIFVGGRARESAARTPGQIGTAAGELHNVTLELLDPEGDGSWRVCTARRG